MTVRERYSLLSCSVIGVMSPKENRLLPIYPMAGRLGAIMSRIT